MLDIDPARGRPAQRRGRQRRPPDRRGGDGPDAVRRVRRGAVQLPAPLHRLDDGRERGRAQRRRGPPRLVRRPGPAWPPTPPTRAASTAGSSGPASTTWPTPRPSAWSARRTSRRARAPSASPSACRRSGMVGVVDDILVDRAFIAERQSSAAELCTIDDLASPAPHVVANALAAAALARAHGISAGRGARRAARLPARRPPDRDRRHASGMASPGSTTPRPPTPTPRCRR